MAFQNLMEAMTQAPMLAQPDFSQPFTIECDASGSRMGAVLIQMGSPITYLSHQFHGRNLNLSTYEKELLAIIIVVKKWRPYLLGRKFVIHIDQRSLKFLLEQRIATSAQQQWLSKLMGFHYTIAYKHTIAYKRGKDNGAANAFSHVQECEASAIPIPIPSWIAKFKEDCQEDPHLKQQKDRLENKNLDLSKYSYKDASFGRRGIYCLGHFKIEKGDF